ncbi:MAG: cytochrome c3 family protein [Deltaproteobacteria bacterium]|jgi:c(7)-type cytochrome triheme protein|nr:cytochrome c3 family protein [Deltaproteobacteria bacterium]
MQKLSVLIVAILFVSSTVVLAVPAKKTIEFNESPMGSVTFDGTIHKEAGIKCKECHNSGMFPKMKQGTVKITMEEIYAGNLCGVCHNGQRAFDAKSNCARCHVKQ